MKKAKKERTGNGRGYIIAGILTALLALGVWGILIMAENRILNANAKVQRYAFAMDAVKGTVIDDAALESGLLKIIEIDQTLVPDNCMLDLEEIKGSYLSSDVRNNTLCTSNLLKKNSVAGNSKTISFAVSEFVRATAGKLRANDKVDVYIIPANYAASRYLDEEKEDLTPAYRDVFLEAVYDSNGVLIANDDTDGVATTFSIAVNEKNADEIVSKLAQGNTVWLVKTE